MKISSESSISAASSRNSCFPVDEEGGARQLSITRFFAPQPKAKIRKRQTSPLLPAPSSASKSDSENSINSLAHQHAARGKSRRSVSVSSKSKILRPTMKRNKLSPHQTYLDVGQESFGEKSFCRTCGMLYDQRLEEDSKQHSRVCQDFVQGVPFHVETARVVASCGTGASIIEVRCVTTAFSFIFTVF
jgi:hypothetical protein